MNLVEFTPAYVGDIVLTVTPGMIREVGLLCALGLADWQMELALKERTGLEDVRGIRLLVVGDSRTGCIYVRPLEQSHPIVQMPVCSRPDQDPRRS